MTLSVSAALLFGLLVFLLWRYARLPIWQGLVCIVFGYLLASSSLGPYIGEALRDVARFIAGIQL